MARVLPRSARHDLTFEIAGASDKLRLVTCLLWQRTWRCADWTRPTPTRIACAVLIDGLAAVCLERVPQGAYTAVLLTLAAPDDLAVERVLGVDVVAGAASCGVALDQALVDPTPATFLVCAPTRLPVLLSPASVPKRGDRLMSRALP